MITINDLDFDEYDVLVATSAAQEARPDDARLQGITTQIIRTLGGDVATMPENSILVIQAIVLLALQQQAVYEALQRYNAYLEYEFSQQ